MRRVILVLHSHIPFVKGYGVWPHGEEWLYEAMLFSYLPIIQHFMELSLRGIEFGVTMGFTPVLMEMLADPEIKKRFFEYLLELEKRAQNDRDVFSSRGEHDMERLASVWIAWLENKRKFYADDIEGDLISALRKLSELGAVELITSAATHAYLPLLSRDESVMDQVRTGVETFEKHIGFEPSGFWLPECGYRPSGLWENPVTGDKRWRSGIEDALAKNGVSYCFLDPSVLGVERMGVPTGAFFDEASKDFARPAGDRHVPRLLTMGSVTGFIRDVGLGMQVWSRHFGYPGDEWYLEFHKKHEGSGLRYWRVTSSRGDLGEKMSYVPERGIEMASVHAAHFVELLKNSSGGEGDIIPLCFDTELFGHWWFEGPMWMRNIVAQLSDRQGEVTILPPGAVGSKGKFEQESRVLLQEGSWGEGGDHSTWFNDETSWMWKSLYEAEDRFYSARWGEFAGNPLVAQIERQAKRELFLLMSSDWMFLVTTGHGKEYGEERFREHLENFRFLMDSFEKVVLHRSLDGRTVARINEITRKDHIFY